MKSDATRVVSELRRQLQLVKDLPQDGCDWSMIDDEFVVRVRRLVEFIHSQELLRDAAAQVYASSADGQEDHGAQREGGERAVPACMAHAVEMFRESLLPFTDDELRLQGRDPRFVAVVRSARSRVLGDSLAHFDNPILDDNELTTLGQLRRLYRLAGLLLRDIELETDQPEAFVSQELLAKLGEARGEFRQLR